MRLFKNELYVVCRQFQFLKKEHVLLYPKYLVVQALIITQGTPVMIDKIRLEKLEITYFCAYVFYNFKFGAIFKRAIFF